jgi:signal transduction histidine kinase
LRFSSSACQELADTRLAERVRILPAFPSIPRLNLLAFLPSAIIVYFRATYPENLMRNLFRLIIVAALIFVARFNSLGQSHYILDESTKSHRVDSYAGVLVDSLNTLTFEDVLAFNHQKFPKVGRNLTFGYTSADIWVKLRLKTHNPTTSWYLEIPAPYLEYVDFHQWDGTSWKFSESGYYRPHGSREVSHTGHVLPLIFNSDSISTVYVRIAGASPKTFPLFIVEKSKFIEHARAEDFGYGIFFGILIVMFFYNLFIYLALRQVNYLLYIITIVLTFLIFSSASGYAGLYFWPNQPMLNFYAGRMSLPLQGIAVAIFTIRFLEVKKYSRVMYYIVASLIPLSILAGILLSTGLLSSAGNTLISIGTILYLAAGIVCRINGNVTANYFIAAWTVYLIGGLFLTLRNSGVLPYNFVTTHLVETGAALETVIIAFALAAHYRRLRIEKEEVHRQALKIQQEATEKLEAKVNERTEQLSKLNDNLRMTLDTNKLQTQIIEDKNVELDSFFYRVSHDLKGPISSLRGLSMLAQMEVRDGIALNYIEKQHQQVERLDLIINGLINLTKLNQSALHKTLIDFPKLVDDCIQSFQTHPKFDRIRFRKEIDAELSFYSEWTLLNAIVQNLVENAIKYSRDTDPFVNISVRKKGDFIIIEVEDNGQGIPLEHQARIFEIFYRATQTSTGSGLGLYILKRSVDRLKGSIDMTSEVDAGSTFTVRLPH